MALLRDDVRRSVDGVQGVLPNVEYDGKALGAREGSFSATSWAG